MEKFNVIPVLEPPGRRLNMAENLVYAPEVEY